MNRAVFLDRDGVLIEDVDILTSPSQIHLLPGVTDSIRRLRQAGFLLLGVTNQPVVARGLISESDLRQIHSRLQELLGLEGVGLDEVYFCPHHPKATLPEYRLDCQCRKPRPGLLLQAAKEKRIDLSASFMVGDRISDIAAGAKAGCRTVWVQTGQHLAPPITSPETIDPALRPDFTCADLREAAQWILRQT